MFAQAMTRQRQADREKRVHKAAIHRALVRQLKREQIKQGLIVEDEDGMNLTDEEDLENLKSTATETTFYDLCNETNSGKDNNPKGKHTTSNLKDKCEKTGTFGFYHIHLSFVTNY